MKNTKILNTVEMTLTDAAYSLSGFYHIVPSETVVLGELVLRLTERTRVAGGYSLKLNVVGDAHKS